MTCGKDYCYYSFKIFLCFWLAQLTLANSSKQASVDQIWKRIVISEMSSKMHGNWRIRQSATKKPWGLHFTVGNPSCKDCCWIFNEHLSYVYTLRDTFSCRHKRLLGIILYRFSQAKSKALVDILINKKINCVMLKGDGNENGIKINRSKGKFI